MRLPNTGNCIPILSHWPNRGHKLVEGCCGKREEDDDIGAATAQLWSFEKQDQKVCADGNNSESNSKLEGV